VSAPDARDLYKTGEMPARRILQSVQQVQVACDRCGAQLETNAAYCERCGTRTRRARRMVGLAIRVEMLFFLMFVGLVVAFIWIYSSQQ
jgi:hypothetical protein